MKIEGIGDLEIHEAISEWLVSSPVETAYFPEIPLRFVFCNLKGDPKPEDFAEATHCFLSLSSNDRDSAAPYVFKNYRKIVEIAYTEDVAADIASPSEVWAHVRPKEVYVSRRQYGDAKIYVSIALECDWEPEHGLQIIYREGRILTRVSDQDGHLTYCDAYGLPESEDRVC